MQWGCSRKRKWENGWQPKEELQIKMWIINLWRSFCSRPFDNHFLAGASMHVFVRRNAIVVVRWIYPLSFRNRRQSTSRDERAWEREWRGEKLINNRMFFKLSVGAALLLFSVFICKLRLSGVVKKKASTPSSSHCMYTLLLFFFVSCYFPSIVCIVKFVAWKKLAHEREWSCEWAGCG